jgi:hypothetical protein
MVTEEKTGIFFFNRVPSSTMTCCVAAMLDWNKIRNFLW